MILTFEAMGTTVVLEAPEHAANESIVHAFATVKEIFAREEQRFSRFRSDSELCGVNRQAASGGAVRVSPAFAEVVKLAIQGAHRTDGLFDPTQLQALAAAGYDRTFSEIAAVPDAEPVAEVASDTESRPRSREERRSHWRQIRVEGEDVVLPPDVMLDLGGIAKGWTADLAATAAAQILGWALVSAGGDLRLAGDAPSRTIGIEDPFSGEDATTVLLDHGALATSSTMRRRWGNGQHHLIDPRTGEPSITGVVQATAWAPTCAEAEIRATRILLAGAAAAASADVALIMDDGTMLVTFVGQTQDERVPASC